MSRCDYCNKEIDWQSGDDQHGNIWECERCGKHFCTSCFISLCGSVGSESFMEMMNESDMVVCPDCFKGKFVSKRTIYKED